MPEIRFQVQWPDGAEEICYSPSLVVKQYFTVGERYELSDFLERSRTALQIASDRVKAKYGFPCGLALGQLQQIEDRVAQYAASTSPQVSILKFIE
ncbi:MAG: MSMEG_0570 family nitrogen starvation response protein [Leptolyngbyaceae cyanobacterium]